VRKSPRAQFACGRAEGIRYPRAMADTVTVDGVAYRIVYASPDQLGLRYDVFRLSNGAEEIVADIHRLKTANGVDTFAGPVGLNPVTRDVAMRIVDAARAAGLVK